MIKSFRHKGLEKFFTKGDASKINPEHTKRLKAMLALIDNAQRVEDTNFPGGNLHPLKGDQKNRYSLTIRANWRLTFEFIGADAYILDYEDYH
jgi:proteic killer suppression protein